ncbi:MAG: hypothetical protein U0Q16_16875 [Bryobacteraceae bacterium]
MGSTTGIAAGKSADEIAATDLTRHKIGSERERNVASLKAVYKKLSGM